MSLSTSTLSLQNVFDISRFLFSVLLAFSLTSFDFLVFGPIFVFCLSCVALAFALLSKIKKRGGSKKRKRKKNGAERQLLLCLLLLLLLPSLSLCSLSTSQSAPSPSPTPPPSRTASWRSSRRTEPRRRPNLIWCNQSRRPPPGSWGCSRGRLARSAPRRSQRRPRRWCRPRGRHRGRGRSRRGSRIPVFEVWVFVDVDAEFFTLLFLSSKLSLSLSLPNALP